MAAVLAGLLAILAWGSGCEDPESADTHSEAKGSGSSSSADDPGGSSSEPSKAPAIEYAEGPSPTPETVLARAGDLEVTLADWERFMRRSLFFAPRQNGTPPDAVPEMRLASPKIQMSSLRRLLGAEVIAREVERRGLTPTREEMRAYLKDQSRLADYLPRLEAGPEDGSAPKDTKDGQAADAPAFPDGLGPEDLWAVAERQVARQKLREALLADIDTDQLWEIYQRRHNTIRLLLVSASNSPTTDGINAFIERDRRRDDSRIRAHFEENRSKYRTPKLVRLTMLAAPAGAPASEGLEERLKKAARRLEAGDAPDKLAEKLDLRLKEDQLLVRKENRRAFNADQAGATGYQMDGPRGAYAWRVEGWRESEAATLDGSIRREIASQLLQQKVVPSLEKPFAKMRRALSDVTPGPDGELTDAQLERLRQKAENLDLSMTVTEPFPMTAQGNIPGIGLAKPVAEAAFSMPEDRSVAQKPILSRGTAYLFRVLQRQSPSRKRFEADLESFRQKIRKERKHRIVQKFLADWMKEHSPDLKTKPLRIKYGTLQKK